MSKTHKILIIEDEVQVVTQLRDLLDEAGYRLQVAHTAEKGKELALDELPPDIILLDIMVPQMGGWELCRQLRRHTDIPIIFLTALTHTENVVKGLNVGADDYITKPFNPNELLARVAAHLRRKSGLLKEQVSFGDGEIEVDLNVPVVQVRGEDVELTPREFGLFSVLVRNAGQVVRTQDLLIEGWGEEYADAFRNIKPYIHYLRKKIEEDPAAPKWINTVRGVGYRFGE